jgi:hypothetical protein
VAEGRELSLDEQRVLLGLLFGRYTVNFENRFKHRDTGEVHEGPLDMRINDLADWKAESRIIVTGEWHE